MYNLGISTLLAVIAAALTAFVLTPVAGIIPGVAVWCLSFFLISRRVGTEVQKEMAALEPLVQQRKIPELKARIEKLKKEWGPWQPLLEGQLDAQLGMIDYLQMKWDVALPALERGKWRNWMVTVCVGLVHYRKKRTTDALKMLADAAWVAPKEPMVYVVHAMVLKRTGKEEEALKVLADGLKALPDSELLQTLQSTIANKKKIDISTFPQSWFQFFPEDALKMMNTRGRKGGPMPGAGFPQPKASRKARRGR